MRDKESKIVRELWQYLEKESRIDNFSGAVLVAKDRQSILQYASGFAKL